MKAKSMKKALSLICAGAMVAGMGATLNVQDVEAATAWNTGYSTGATKYLKVALADMTITADSHSTQEGTDTSPQKLIDGNPSTYYHSNYGQGSGSQPNLSANTNNTITINLANPKTLKGVTYLPRQHANKLNGTINSVDVQVKLAGQETFTSVKTFNVNYGNPYNSGVEQELLFDTVQNNVSSVKFVVKGAEGNSFISGSELSLLTPTTDGSQLEVSDYIKNGVRTAPVAPQGKVFAGWFNENTFTTPFTAESGKAYPKFVDAAMLSAKSQTIAGKDSYSLDSTLRFVSTVDTLNYKEVGFDITFKKTNKTISKSTKNVYKELSVVGGNGTKDTVAPNSFSSSSQYFFALNVNGIKAADFEQGWEAKPYLVTLDGTKVYGTKTTQTVNNALSQYYCATIKYADNKESIVKADNWTRFDQENYSGAQKNLANGNTITSAPGIKLNSASGQWTLYKDGFDLALFNAKLETPNDTTSNNKFELDFEFDGTGVAVICQGFGNSGQMNVSVVDASNNQVVGAVKAVDLVNKGRTYLGYSVTNLPKGQYKLLVRDVTKKVSFAGFYVIK